MGMAASQARLLQLTSRLHDIEYKAQNIESQKIALATQKDELYQNYCDALDAKKIQIAYANGDGSKRFVDANFSTVCGYNPDRMTQYTLTDSKTGKIIVTKEEAENYEDYSNDKYSFAWAMMGYYQSNYDPSVSRELWRDAQNVGGIADDDIVTMTWAEEQIYNLHKDSDSKLKAKYDAIHSAESYADKKDALAAFRDELYGNKTYRNEIFQVMNVDKQESNVPPTITCIEDVEALPKCYPDAEFNTDMFNYYVKLWEQIHESAGCTQIDPMYESGDEGNEWFNNMVNSGRVTIQEYNPTRQEFEDVSVGTSTSASYLQKVSDETDLKKAEAEYEYELSVVNNKDKKFDTELSKLETERTSITTEMDSIKKVKDDNIERTFGIFS